MKLPGGFLRKSIQRMINKSGYGSSLKNKGTCSLNFQNHIEKIQEINDLINVLASGIGSLTNASKIEATFKSVYNELRLRGFRVDVGVVMKRPRCSFS